MTHLLVTNDFPPKIGGIQSYLYELWRRLPADRFGVLTIAHEGSEVFDAQQAFPIRRLARDMLTPRRDVLTEIERYASELGASHVVLDPVLPVGLLGPRLSLGYSLVVHGAEIKIPGRLPLTRQLMRRAITHAELIIAAGNYPARETRSIGGRKTPETVIVPPGVDINRFYPLLGNERLVARARFGIAPESIAVVAVSRLVPRKGMDILIEACSALLSQHPSLELVIGGTGRDRERLEAIAQRLGVPVTFLGRVEDHDLPALYAGADLAAMLCRNRWLGLEQEGFGIVFLEAAAAGVAAIAGASGGASEAVLDGITGRVVSRPQRVKEAIAALDELISDRAQRERFGAAARDRVESEFDYDVLASELDRALLRVER